MSDLLNERWTPVPGYESRYEVSDVGRVRSIAHDDGVGHSRRGKVLSPSVNSTGRQVVALYNRGVRRMFKVHRLVLEAFVGAPPVGMIACHNDGNPLNNRIANLRWDTYSANNADTVNHGHHVSPQRKKTHCVHGHLLAGDNLVPSSLKAGVRRCRQCTRLTKQRYAARRSLLKQSLTGGAR